MPCAASDEDHIFMISRLAALLKKTALAGDLRAASDAEHAVECFRGHENAMMDFM
jgi:mannitol/fructose-specific phosphotransferase system IIA component